MFGQTLDSEQDYSIATIKSDRCTVFELYCLFCNLCLY